MKIELYYDKPIQLVTYEHARLPIELRGIAQQSDLGKDWVKLIPWGKEHPLSKIGSSIVIPVHVMISVITGVWELQDNGKNATETNVTSPS